MLTSNDVFKEFKGSFSENYVLQQLKSLDDLDIFYFTKDHSSQDCSMKPYIDQGWMENIPLFSILSYMNQQLQKEKYAP